MARKKFNYDLVKLEDHHFKEAGNLLKCDGAIVEAIAKIEAPKGGFNEDGTPVTLFEGHWFHKFTEGKYDQNYQNISYPRWTRKYYGKTQEEEKERLKQACALNRNAGLMSASWGKFQIMGFNFSVCGFQTIQKFVNAMYKSESSQLYAFCQYILNSGLNTYLNTHIEPDFESFAYFYNGPLYKKNKYAERLRKAYRKFSGK